MKFNLSEWALKNKGIVLYFMLLLGIVASLGQGQADPELRAAAGAALHADLAAHLLDQALGDDQAEAGAAGLARHGVVRLAEGLEQRAQVLIGQADAGVLHAKIAMLAIIMPANGNRPAFWGVFNCISD